MILGLLILIFIGHNSLACNLGKVIFPQSQLANNDDNHTDNYDNYYDDYQEHNPYHEASLNETVQSLAAGSEEIKLSELIHFPDTVETSNFAELNLQTSESSLPDQKAFIDEDSILSSFSLLKKQRHHENEKLKNEARRDILNHFRKYKFTTFEQKFTAKKTRNTRNEFTGYNLIAIWPGQSRDTNRDQILLVGGHYDTVKGTTGIDDNGSGTVALLEIARMIGETNPILNHTIYLVAFDLEEEGMLGSKAFVSKYLIPEEIEKRKSQFMGAYVTDMILTFDNATNSQSLPEKYDWKTHVPKAFNEIEKNGRRGDFASIWMRRNVEDKLWETFKRSFQSIESNQFKVIPFDIDLPENPIIDEGKVPFPKSTFLRSDHATFWYHGQSNIPSLKAILISDLGPWRGYQRNCYHKPCDNMSQITREKLTFMMKIIQAIYDVIIFNPPKLRERKNTDTRKWFINSNRGFNSPGGRPKSRDLDNPFFVPGFRRFPDRRLYPPYYFGSFVNPDHYHRQDDEIVDRLY